MEWSREDDNCWRARLKRGCVWGVAVEEDWTEERGEDVWGGAGGAHSLSFIEWTAEEEEEEEEADATTRPTCVVMG